jgi:hypothetical protein
MFLVVAVAAIGALGLGIAPRTFLSIAVGCLVVFGVIFMVSFLLFRLRESLARRLPDDDHESV